MSNSALENLALTGNDSKPSVARTVKIALGAWLAVVLTLGALGAFAQAPGALPLPVFAGVVIPLIVFAIALRASEAFRAFVLALDLRLIVAVQAWRFAGFGFIALYANHVLPGLFAWPAGLGDMAIGAVAPWLVVSLARDPAVTGSSGFRLWNTLGIVDLVVAVSAATICSLSVGAPGSPSIAPMAELPLVLIPAFLVPLFVMLHVAALLSARTSKAVRA
jgi:hypothetical protein